MCCNDDLLTEYHRYVIEIVRNVIVKKDNCKFIHCQTCGDWFLMPSPFIKYIQNEQHYTEIISQVATVKHSLWIGTADIKDLYVMKGNDAVPFLSMLADLLKKGVDVRLIHAKEPGQMFRDDFDKYPILATDLERVCCPRVHFKLMIFDTETAYIGSANLTGAGMGMKIENRRNFEAGILTNDPEFVESAINQFDKVRIGVWCKNCGQKDACIDRIGEDWIGSVILAVCNTFHFFLLLSYYNRCKGKSALRRVR